MSEREILETPLTTTLKLDGGNAPWIVLRSRDAQHLQSQLTELEAGGVGADIGRVLVKLNATYAAGKILDATPVDPHPSTGAMAQPVQAITEQAPPAASALAPAPTPAPAQPAPQAPPAAPPAPPAQPLMAPNPFAGRPLPAAAPNPFAAQPTGAPDPVWNQPLPGNDPWQQPASQTPGCQQAPPAGPPGAPIVLGRPAQLVTGPGWTAYADPRPTSLTANITQDTDDPNHPGLAAGTHKFWKKL